MKIFLLPRAAESLQSRGGGQVERSARVSEELRRGSRRKTRCAKEASSGGFVENSFILASRFDELGHEAMDADELAYNAFYLLLRNEYKKKYEYAVSKCWTICVPCGDSLRGVSITKEFVDDHVLKPLTTSGDSQTRRRFCSTDEDESQIYEIDGEAVRLVENEKEQYRAKILSMEMGYNKEFQPYNIIIVDRPIHRKYRIAQISQSNKLRLNRNICSYKEAIEFLKELPADRSCPLDDLVTEVERVDTSRDTSLEELRKRLQGLFRDFWASTMRKQSLDVQRDARFQKLLSVSLEMFVMHLLHEGLYGLISRLFESENAALHRKIDELIRVGVTPDQLGVRESLAISLPSAMVELATLDTHKGPLEKLMCLKCTLDFIVAEIKGALANMESNTDSLNDDEDALCHCSLDTDDLIPLLSYVIIKCRCQRLRSDQYYLENFIWSVSPHDELSYTLVTFKAAVSLLEKIDVSNLPKRSDKVKTELETTDYLKVAQIKEIKTPLDRQMRDLAKMIEECTQT